MNVALKLPDELVREARHLALDENTSLSAMVAELLILKVEEKAEPVKPLQTLDEAMMVPGMPDSFCEKDFLLPDRKKSKHREFTFGPDDECCANYSIPSRHSQHRRFRSHWRLARQPVGNQRMSHPALDSQGGLGEMHQLFGDSMDSFIEELTEGFVA